MSAEIFIQLHNIPKHEIGLEEFTGIDLIPEEIPEGAIGEPLTFTLAVTVGGLGIVAAYLLRKSKYKSFEENIEIVKPDGTKIKKVIRYKEKQAEAGKAEVINQIVKSIEELMNL
ncbi:hypothetical protein [Chryseobacterium sp. G0162]|uniref:hypothetical protein n=1 Tax=Chryseobacterium sp. G0162 TaxID=2487063 RepID=UPI000F5026DC|nr:hypothetical protein [Chryseobacterium sp. G0162]